MQPIRRIISQYNSKGLTDAEEIAQLLDCSVRRVHYFLEGQTELKAEEVRVLAQFFSNMGRLELSYLFVAPNFGIARRGDQRINGSMYDELKDSLNAIDDMVHHFESDKPDEAMKAIDKARDVLNRAEAEVKNRRG